MLSDATALVLTTSCYTPYATMGRRTAPSLLHDFILSQHCSTADKESVVMEHVKLVRLRRSGPWTVSRFGPGRWIAMRSRQQTAMRYTTKNHLSDNSPVVSAAASARIVQVC
jgi:hypothetical protein